MNSVIKAISYYLPPKILTNDELSKEFPEWSVDSIANKTGIFERHIAEPEICASDLGVASAQKLFAEHSIAPNDIDFLLFCTQSPDYFLPTTACIIQEKLGIPRTAGALDYNLGCSGYVYGLGLARGLIASGDAKNVLLIVAETYSKHLHPKDKSVRTIFGDGAAATLITAHEPDTGEGVASFVYGTDGKGAKNLIVNTGGMRNRRTAESGKDYVDEFENVRNDDTLFMDGAEIFNFTLLNIPSLVNEVLKKANLQKDQIDLYVFHQANKFMLNALRKKLGIDQSKFYEHLSQSGNTVSASIPIALYHALLENKIQKGMKVMLVGFGVGYSWAGCIIQY